MSEQHLTGGSGDTPMLDAATVVLLRDSEAGIECLMVRKNSGQAFGGMWVFPGGRVEDGDGTGLEGAGVPRSGRRPRRPAWCSTPPRWSRSPTGRRLRPPPAATRPGSSWGRSPDGAADVIVDGGEIGDHLWTPPAVALELHAAGDIELVPPTWVTLQRLAEAGAVMDSATAAVRPRRGARSSGSRPGS
jgi:8-oxo-dGTP pyrophosphatase MutT (NUDIX family)